MQRKVPGAGQSWSMASEKSSEGLGERPTTLDEFISSNIRVLGRPISANPGSMEGAGEYGLTRGTCFVARRLEVVAVARLL